MNYARYMTWYLRNIENLPTAAKNDLVKGAHICRHTDGGTAVPADQFGEQTYIRRGKDAGVLRGISTNVEQVAVWVGSFSVCAHLDLAIEAMSSVLGSRSIAHLHLTWCWSTPASCCTMLSGLSLGQQAILP